MTALGGSPGLAGTGATSDAGLTAQQPLLVHNCRRLGLQANPPAMRLNLNWFRRR